MAELLRLARMAGSLVGTGLTLLLGLAALAGGLICRWSVGDLLWSWYDARGWVRADATIVTVDEVYEFSGPGGGASREVRCRYTYRFGNTDYTSDRVTPQLTASGSLPRSIYTSLKRSQERGELVPCYVNPHDPRRAVLYRDLPRARLMLLLVVAVVFSSVGLAIVGGSIWALRRWRGQQRLRLAYPDQPWLWNVRWAGGVLRSDTTIGALGWWFAAVVVNGIAWLATLLIVLPGLLGSPRRLALAVFLVFPALGLWLVAKAVRRTIQWVRFGRAELRLRAMPARVGGSLDGALILPRGGERAAEVRLELRCVRSQRDGGRTADDVVWHARKAVRPQPAATDAAALLVPVQFAIPADCPPADFPGRDTRWELRVAADLPGVDLDLAFDVPVFAP